MLSLPLRAPAQVLLIGGLDLGLLGLELLAAPPQPGQAGAAVGQLGGQLVAPSGPVLGVLGRVDLLGFGEHPVDFLADRRVAARRLV